MGWKLWLTVKGKEPYAAWPTKLQAQVYDLTDLIKDTEHEVR